MTEPDEGLIRIYIDKIHAFALRAAEHGLDMHADVRTVVLAACNDFRFSLISDRQAVLQRFKALLRDFADIQRAAVSPSQEVMAHAARVCPDAI